MIPTNGKMILGSNSSKYIDLLITFPPRLIKSEEDLSATQDVIDSLIDRGSLTPDEKDYLNLLGTLVYEYEQKQSKIPDIYGVDLLKFLIEESGIRQKDLVAIFKTESIVSDILNNRRKLTARHIQELAKMFNISPAAFFPATTVGCEK